MVVKGYLNFLPVTGGNSCTTVDITGFIFGVGKGRKESSGEFILSGAARHLSIGYLASVSVDNGRARLVSVAPFVLAYTHVTISPVLIDFKCMYPFPLQVPLYGRIASPQCLQFIMSSRSGMHCLWQPCTPFLILPNSNRHCLGQFDTLQQRSWDVSLDAPVR
jgi:hypothetical protein